jgi:hypothetical protein
MREKRAHASEASAREGGCWGARSLIPSALLAQEKEVVGALARYSRPLCSHKRRRCSGARPLLLSAPLALEKDAVRYPARSTRTTSEGGCSGARSLLPSAPLAQKKVIVGAPLLLVLLCARFARAGVTHVLAVLVVDLDRISRAHRALCGPQLVGDPSVATRQATS